MCIRDSSKQAVDLGYPSAHLIGSLRFSAAGLERPADLTADLRSAWSRRTGVALAAAPAEGYAYVPAVAPAAPALSKGLKPATAPKQFAVLWAEQYAVGADGSQTLLFLRLADAHSFRIIASELVLTDTGAATAVGALVLRDERLSLIHISEPTGWLSRSKPNVHSPLCVSRGMKLRSSRSTRAVSYTHLTLPTNREV